MVVLIELVKVVKRGRFRVDQLLKTVSGDNSRIMELYKGISEGVITDDETAAQAIYQEEPNKNLQKLKARLRSRLINLLFVVDINKAALNERDSAYTLCCKEWAATKILFTRGARNAAVKMAKLTLSNALRFEFSELILDISRTLRMHYALWKRDAKQYEQYDALCREYEAIWQCENEAEQLYLNMVMLQSSTRLNRTRVRAQAEAFYRRVAPAMARYESYKLQLCGRLIEIAMHDSISDHPATIKACDDAIRFFQAKPFDVRVPFLAWTSQKLTCYIHLREYGKGSEVVKEALNLFEAGSLNWMQYQRMRFLLAMHSGKYEEAYSVWGEATAYDDILKQLSAQHETWAIFEAYLNFLIAEGRLTPTQDALRQGSFRLGKFLNETPRFSKEKRGMNIPILVIQILFLIRQRQYDQVIDKMEAIDRYRMRYLRQDDTFRSNCFIHMLLTVPAAGFHREGARRRAAGFLEKMSNAPANISNETSEIEIIPYEVLWELVLDSLSLKIRKAQSSR
ncbi:MAG: hypothetical protein KF852_00150 [Saprospiraceae bacterium]|nr:hypothetical protein [Saprospiraceae bacterium]